MALVIDVGLDRPQEWVDDPAEDEAAEWAALQDPCGNPAKELEAGFILEQTCIQVVNAGEQ